MSAINEPFVTARPFDVISVPRTVDPEGQYGFADVHPTRGDADPDRLYAAVIKGKAGWVIIPASFTRDESLAESWALRAYHYFEKGD